MLFTPNQRAKRLQCPKEILKMSCTGRSEKVVELESSTSKVAELQIGQNFF